jgi:putative ABC transport system substrate-binding protein
MRRREFIASVGAAAVAGPRGAWAQQAALPVIGFLSPRPPGVDTHLLAAFHQGLKEFGYIEGQNVAIEYRWADFQLDRLPTMAADLVRRRVTVIAATGGTAAASAAKMATTTIPIVFAAGGNPVKEGLVASLNRPGGNVTGMSLFTLQVGPKQLGLLHAMIPTATVIAVLVNQNNLDSETQLEDIQAAAPTLGLRILALSVDSERDFEMAFATLVRQGAGALLITGHAFFTAHRVQLAVLAARHAIPTIYTLREFPMAGGLMSYAPNIADAHRQVGVYIGRILKGEKPADLPVMQPTKFELVINLKTAKTLGLTIPPTLLAVADEVIE